MPDLQGQAGATGLQDVAEDEAEEISVDSDIIDDDDIPEPFDDPTISVVDEEIEAILNQEQQKRMKEVVGTLKIDKSMMLNLQAQEGLVATQFLCLICDNMVIPKFILGKDGVKQKSIRLP